MKKILICGGLIIVIIFELIGCDNNSCSNSKETNLLLKEDSIILKKSNDDIIEISFNWLDNERKESIIDMNNAKIEEVTYKEDYFVISNEGSINVKDKLIYKVTFNTSTEILGPIVIYVDKDKFEVLGTDIRK